MGSDFSSPWEPVKAPRRSRACNWCGEIIAVGEPHQRCAVVWEGEFGELHMHNECVSASEAWARGEPYGAEYMVGGMRRGCSVWPDDDCDCARCAAREVTP